MHVDELLGSLAELDARGVVAHQGLQRGFEVERMDETRGRYRLASQGLRDLWCKVTGNQCRLAKQGGLESEPGHWRIGVQLVDHQIAPPDRIEYLVVAHALHQHEIDRVATPVQTLHRRPNQLRALDNRGRRAVQQCHAPRTAPSP